MPCTSVAIAFTASVIMMTTCARSGPEPVCVPGAAAACTCEGDLPGAKSCNVTGQYARCVCRSRTERRHRGASAPRTQRARCSTVAYHLVQLALRHLWDNPGQTPDESEAAAELIDKATAEFSERCEADDWSDAQRSCILNAESMEEVSACGEL